MLASVKELEEGLKKFESGMESKVPEDLSPSCLLDLHFDIEKLRNWLVCYNERKQTQR